MNLREGVDRLHQTERLHDVYQHTYNNLPIWFFIKVGVQWKVKSASSNAQKRISVLSPFVSFPGYWLNLPFWWLRFTIKYFRFKQQVNRLPQTDILFGPADYYSDQILGKQYNRHVDPFLERLKKVFKSKRIQKLHDCQGTSEETFSHKPLCFDMSLLNGCAYYQMKMAGVQRKGVSIYRDRNIVTQFDEDVIEYAVSATIQTYFAARLAKKVLETMKPKTLFLVCYYSAGSMPFLFAARQLNIDVIDIQHGKQGKYHPCYTHHVKLPPQTISPFPDVFWNWGEPSAHHISSWFKKTHRNDWPTCFPGGNLWMAKWLHEEVGENDKNLPGAENKTAYDTRILFCSQPIEPAIPGFIFEYARCNESSFVSIRLHPLQYAQLDKWKQVCSNYQNVDVEKSTRLPLYFLLKHTDVLVTFWSSVCIEALQFGVRAILVHENGRLLFEEYIEKGYFHFARDMQSLDQAINNIRKFNRNGINDNYIETRYTEIDKYLSEIIESKPIS